MRQFGGRKHAIDGPLESVSSNPNTLLYFCLTLLDFTLLLFDFA